jgi:hypothetical protein
MAVKPEVYEQHFELGASYTVTFERAVDETPQSPAVPI